MICFLIISAKMSKFFSVMSEYFLASLKDAGQEASGNWELRALGVVHTKNAKVSYAGLHVCQVKPPNSSRLRVLSPYASCAHLTLDRLKISQTHTLSLFGYAAASCLIPASPAPCDLTCCRLWLAEPRFILPAGLPRQAPGKAMQALPIGHTLALIPGETLLMVTPLSPPFLPISRHSCRAHS